MNDEKNPDIVAQFDQFEAHMENSANLFAIYYQKLIACGLPASTAEKLTADFSILFWNTVLMPGTNRRM